MNMKQLAKLTDEEIRLKCCELHFGEKPIVNRKGRRDFHGNLIMVAHNKNQYPARPLEDVPNYLNDLNAMHEAEKVIPPELMAPYMTFLGLTTFTGDRSSIETLSQSIMATARQRAEAFILVMTYKFD
jgi:hypothetical protein